MGRACFEQGSLPSMLSLAGEALLCVLPGDRMFQAQRLVPGCDMEVPNETSLDPYPRLLRMGGSRLPMLWLGTWRKHLRGAMKTFGQW